MTAPKTFKKAGFTFEVHEDKKLGREYTLVRIIMKKPAGAGNKLDIVGGANISIYHAKPVEAERSRIGVDSDFRDKRLGSLLSEVVNDYLLGKLKVKPPLKPQVIFTTRVHNPKAARKLIDQGYLMIGEPEPGMRSRIFSPVGKGVLEKLFSPQQPNPQMIGKREFLLKRRAYRKRHRT
jgi:hypothetical protein